MLGVVKENNKGRRTALLLGAFLAVFLFLFLYPTPYPLHPISTAQAVDVGINAVPGLGTAPDIRTVIARIINIALGFLATTALLITLWGGFQWMMAGGEDEKINAAKKTLINGAIGLAIILSAWAITRFIFNSFIAGPPPGPGRVTGVAETYIPRSASLGQGLIEMHYPERGQVDVPRNTNIMITFKKKILLSSIITNVDPDTCNTQANGCDLKDLAIKIYRNQPGVPANQLPASDIRVFFTPDHMTFVLNPYGTSTTNHLGSASEYIKYFVDLPPDGLLEDDDTADGRSAFTGEFSDGYLWDFTTGTFIDTTPPYVINCLPDCSIGALPEIFDRNILIQINFNEPMDPTSIVRENNILVEHGGTVSGDWLIANRYRSVEFRPDFACGTNSCGETIYCLPANETIQVTAKAASLTADPNDGPAAAPPWNGLVDTAGNSLNDRHNNEEAEGQSADNVFFDFNTSNTINLITPIISAVSPRGGGSMLEAGDVNPSGPIMIDFSKFMSLSSINSSALTLHSDPPSPIGSPNASANQPWYSTSSANLTSANLEPTEGDPANHTRAIIGHGLFLKAAFGATQYGYVPAVLEKVRDAYQNCFTPTVGPECQAGEFTGSNNFCCNGTTRASATCGIPGTNGQTILPPL